MKIDINKCIKYVACAWDNVINAIIEHCWTKVNILPNNDNEDYANAKFEDYDANIKLEIQRLKKLEEV